MNVLYLHGLFHKPLIHPRRQDAGESRQIITMSHFVTDFITRDLFDLSRKRAEGGKGQGRQRLFGIDSLARKLMCTPTILPRWRFPEKQIQFGPR